MTSVTTVKTWLNITGNDLIFVFKKPGSGHAPTLEPPSHEQVDWFTNMLIERGLDRREAVAIVTGMRDRGLWSATAFHEVSTLLQPMSRTEVEEWLKSPGVQANEQ